VVAALLLILPCVTAAQDGQQAANTAKFAVLMKLSGGLKRPMSLFLRSLPDGHAVTLRERGPQAIRSVSSGWGEELSVFRIPAGEYELDRWMADFEDESGYHTAVSEPLRYRFRIGEGEALVFGRLDLQMGSASKGKLSYTLSHAALQSDELDRISNSLHGHVLRVSPLGRREGRAAVTGTFYFQ
jgi:hypothetical protein